VSASRRARILLVDDDETFRQVMSEELERRGFAVERAASAREALDRFPVARPEVTLLDLRLPDGDGIETLSRLRQMDPDTAVIVLTGHGTIDTAIQAIRQGAYDYLEKPCPIDKLEMAIEKAEERVRLVRRQQVLEDGFGAADPAPRLVGSSQVFRDLLERVDRVARAEETTLVLGETGVGKEVVATLVHSRSPRGNGPFIAVNCAALHEELLQSDLFGHERGAFTGAAKRKHGLFEVASGGTIFLDEIGDASLDIQAKLLRVLETGRFRRLGGTEEIAVDVRAVAASNRDLREAISRRRFREDLFYRLSTLTLEIPPLRERREDIPQLIEHFASRFNRKLGSSRRFTEAAYAALLAYTWPGNVRELIHVVQQSLLLSEDDEIGIADLPPAIRGTEEPASENREREGLTLEQVQRQHVLSVLDRVGGNRARAAAQLGISERNLYRLLRRYGGGRTASV